MNKERKQTKGKGGGVLVLVWGAVRWQIQIVQGPLEVECHLLYMMLYKTMMMILTIVLMPIFTIAFMLMLNQRHNVLGICKSSFFQNIYSAQKSMICEIDWCHNTSTQDKTSSHFNLLNVQCRMNQDGNSIINPPSNIRQTKIRFKKEQILSNNC